jgi:hypothetical protein
LQSTHTSLFDSAPIPQKTQRTVAEKPKKNPRKTQEKPKIKSRNPIIKS